MYVVCTYIFVYLPVILFCLFRELFWVHHILTQLHFYQYRNRFVKSCGIIGHMIETLESKNHPAEKGTEGVERIEVVVAYLREPSWSYPGCQPSKSTSRDSDRIGTVAEMTRTKWRLLQTSVHKNDYFLTFLFLETGEVQFFTTSPNCSQYLHHTCDKFLGGHDIISTYVCQQCLFGYISASQENPNFFGGVKLPALHTDRRRNSVGSPGQDLVFIDFLQKIYSEGLCFSISFSWEKPNGHNCSCKFH